MFLSGLVKATLLLSGLSYGSGLTEILVYCYRSGCAVDHQLVSAQ